MKLPLRLGTAKKDMKNGGEFYVVKDAEGAWIGDIRAEHAPEIVLKINGLYEAEQPKWHFGNPDDDLPPGAPVEDGVTIYTFDDRGTWLYDLPPLPTRSERP
jgi:hypothetical protein